MNFLISNSVKADIFTQLFTHMKMFTEHINIMFENGRMYIQTMDTSRVSIIEITVVAGWFDSYAVASPVTIGINATRLSKILSTRDKSQSLSVELVGDESDKLFVHFTGDDKSIFNKHFELPLIELDADLLSIPQIDYSAEFTLSSTSFANLINQMKLFGDTMDIECSEEHIKMFSNSQDNGKMQVNVDIDDLTSFAINEGETLNLSFSLQYLHNICAFQKLAKDVDIRLSPDYPMQVSYSFGDEGAAVIKFYLAPKVSED